MNLVSFALRRPISLLTMVVAVALVGFLAVDRMSRDIFPDLGVPVLYVAQPYGGMDPAQMEGFIVNYYEYEAEFLHSVLNRLISSRLRIEPGDHLPQRRREVLIVTLHGILPAIPGMVALFRAVQVIVRTRLTDRERPFSVIGPGP